jgi:hypothetical protein
MKNILQNPVKTLATSAMLGTTLTAAAPNIDIAQAATLKNNITESSLTGEKLPKPASRENLEKLAFKVNCRNQHSVPDVFKNILCMVRERANYGKGRELQTKVVLDKGGPQWFSTTHTKGQGSIPVKQAGKLINIPFGIDHYKGHNFDKYVITPKHISSGNPVLDGLINLSTKKPAVASGCKMNSAELFILYNPEETIKSDAIAFLGEHVDYHSIKDTLNTMSDAEKRNIPSLFNIPGATKFNPKNYKGRDILLLRDCNGKKMGTDLTQFIVNSPNTPSKTIANSLDPKNLGFNKNYQSILSDKKSTEQKAITKAPEADKPNFIKDLKTQNQLNNRTKAQSLF